MMLLRCGILAMALALLALKAAQADELSDDPKRQPALVKVISTNPANELQAREAENPPITIERFEVTGNTLLDADLVKRLLAPFQGTNKSYTDIQRALEALEGAYRSAGYSAVSVITPEQDITDGVVSLIVVQAVVDKISIEGNRYYDAENIRRALPALQAGQTPSARELAQNIRLANENPTRNLEVVLALGEEEGKVDAKIKVKDASPHKVFFTLDNTGNKSTGYYRSGVGYQYSNLFNRDQSLMLNYTTSPDHMQEVKQIVATYHLPIYGWGSSMDLTAAHSSTDTAIAPLAINGKGSILGARYNHSLPRRGDYVSRLGYALDYRAFTNSCLNNGLPLTGVGACEDITVHPLSLSYEAQVSRPTWMLDYAATVVQNLPFGSTGLDDTFEKVRSGSKAGYSILRMNGSIAGLAGETWQYRIAATLQYAPVAVIPQEKFGLVGANAVRGFHEREVFATSADRGFFINAELYGPELAENLKLDESSLRPLVFVDHGRSEGIVASASDPGNSNAATSAGAGVRLSLYKNLVAKLDVARVLTLSENSDNQNPDLTSIVQPGRVFLHFSLMASW